MFGGAIKNIKRCLICSVTPLSRTVVLNLSTLEAPLSNLEAPPDRLKAASGKCLLLFSLLFVSENKSSSSIAKNLERAQKVKCF